jgi:cell shape-determining protein MreD
MEKTRKKTIARIFIILPYLLVLYILQGTVLPHVRFFGMKPLILPLAVVGTALFDGKESGGTMGLFIGMLCDLSFNQPTVLYTLTLTAMGLIIGYLSDTVLITGFPTYLIVSAVSLLFFSFVQMFSLLFFMGQPFVALFDTAWRQTASSLILSLPMYYITRYISRVI